MMGAVTTVNAAEPIFDIGIGYQNYKANDTKDGTSYSAHVGALIETELGQFHKLRYSRSMSTESEFRGIESKKDKIEQISYAIGQTWYPRNHASDFSFWTGVGHLSFENDDAKRSSLTSTVIPEGWVGTGDITFTDGDGNVLGTESITIQEGQTITVGTHEANDRKLKLLYIPFGFEGGTPMFGSTKNYFVYGGELRYIFNADFTLDGLSDNKTGGTGNEFWFGFDFRLQDSVIQARLTTETMKIDLNDYKYQSNNLKITYRF